MRNHAYRDIVAFSFVITALLMVTVPALAAGHIAVFGDSLSDTGNIFAVTSAVSTRPYNESNIPDAPYPIGGLNFSNGRVWIQEVGRQLDNVDDVSAALVAPPAFNNYAFGAARARAGASPVPSLSEQVDLYLGMRGDASDTEQIIVIGGNDVRDAIEAYLTSGPAAAGDIIRDAVAAISYNIERLSDSGAQDFLVGNVPDLGKVPAVTAVDKLAGLASFLTMQFNDTIESALMELESGSSLRIARLNLFSLINDVVDNPGTYGLLNVTESCLTPAVQAGAICDDPDSYLFWDGIHPTRAGHFLIANEALSVMP